MIGKTAIDEHLNKVRLLIDAVAWIEAHNTATKNILLEYIRSDQLFNQGVNMHDEIIGTYSEFTEFINPSKEAGTPYTLKDTGAFYRSMFVQVLKDSILIDANFTKMEDKDWWSVDILGLNEENLNNYAELVKDNYIKYARKVLQLD